MPLPKIAEDQLNIDWEASVATYDDLLLKTGMDDGDTVLVRDDDTFYEWDEPTLSWVVPTAYAKGFTNGCRLVWNSATQVTVVAGSLDIKGRVCEKAVDTALTFSDLEAGSAKKANTWYYVYLERLVLPSWATGVSYAIGVQVQYKGRAYRCLQAHTSQEVWKPDASPALWTDIGAVGVYSKQFKAFLSEQAPTKDQNGNTISPDTRTAKYHPTRNARFVGSVRTNASQNIIQFIVNGSYVAYLGLTNYNYILQGGTATSKTAVNCRAFVPVTSSLAQVYYEMGSGNNTRYVGDVTSFYLKAIAGAGQLMIPVTNNSIYYQCGGNSISLGIHGYYEDI